MGRLLNDFIEDQPDVERALETKRRARLAVLEFKAKRARGREVKTVECKRADERESRWWEGSNTTNARFHALLYGDKK